MAVGTNRWKLGLFVIVGFGVALCALLLLGARALESKGIEFVSFFDESVQGLELGSPVKFRGVTVGHVTGVDIAENLRHVAVKSEISVAQVDRLKLGARGKSFRIHPNMRVQLAQTGITGVKFILIDFFDSTQNPVVPLPFQPPPNYIPTAPSMMKNIEDSVVKTTNRFPEIADDAARAMAQVRVVAEQIEQGRIPARTAETLTHADTALAELNAQLKAMNTAGLSREAEKNLQEFNAILVRTTALLTRLDSERGLLSNAERSADAIGEMARGAKTLGPELELTLREVRSAARSIKRLADTLERDPDMLLKGRAAQVSP